MPEQHRPEQRATCDGGGEDAAGERSHGQGPDAEIVAEHGNDGNRAGGGPRRQAEQEGVGKIVTGHRLQKQGDCLNSHESKPAVGMGVHGLFVHA